MQCSGKSPSDLGSNLSFASCEVRDLVSSHGPQFLHLRKWANETAWSTVRAPIVHVLAGLAVTVCGLRGACVGSMEEILI